MTNQPPGNPDRLRLAQTSFETVLAADDHLDQEATRVLQAVAFLSTVVAALYVSAAPPYSEGLVWMYGGVHLSAWAMAGYVVSIVLGALVSLSATGAPLVAPKRRSARPSSVESSLFFERIARVDQKVWMEHWEQDAAALIDNRTENYVFETYLLAQGALSKYVRIQWSGVLFRIALGCLILLVASLLDPVNPQAARWTAVAAMTAWTLVWIVSDARRSGQTNWVFAASGVLCTAVVLMCLFGKTPLPRIAVTPEASLPQRTLSPLPQRATVPRHERHLNPD